MVYFRLLVVSVADLYTLPECGEISTIAILSGEVCAAAVDCFSTPGSRSAIITRRRIFRFST